MLVEPTVRVRPSMLCPSFGRFPTDRGSKFQVSQVAGICCLSTVWDSGFRDRIDELMAKMLTRYSLPFGLPVLRSWDGLVKALVFSELRIFDSQRVA